MKAAAEEVNKTLEKAGQNISFENNNPIRLNQMQLNDMPVLGRPATLQFTSCNLWQQLPTCRSVLLLAVSVSLVFVCVLLCDPHISTVTRDYDCFHIGNEETYP